jgi:hypothetical protein
MPGPSDESLLENVNAQLALWRQGDFVLGEVWFVHRFAPAGPITAEAAEVADGGADLCETLVQGLVVTSQSCDIVRDCRDRPFIEVSPLVTVPAKVIEDSRRGRRPRYGFIRGAAEFSLVADLDRTMTVEKAVVAQWQRKVGCVTGEDERRLAEDLARKRSRFPFPDDFADLVRPLRDRIVEKHDRRSLEGSALRSLREIRVAASPSWDHDRVELFFWFIRDDESALEGGTWQDCLERWLERVGAAGRYVSVEGVVVTLDQIIAREYVESDRLDLDHLSRARSLES